jgi:hypothetical protein
MKASYDGLASVFLNKGKIMKVHTSLKNYLKVGSQLLNLPMPSGCGEVAAKL